MSLTRKNLRDFLNKAFEKVSKEYTVGEDYQRRAAKYGKTFECCFKSIMSKFFPEVPLSESVPIPEACFSGGGAADFAVLSGEQHDGKVVAVIEAKGAADYIIKDRKKHKLSRPGLLRTDTVKKAISNAYQVSIGCPDALFFIATSHKPKTGNAKCMCDMAEGDIVDKIVDVTDYSELKTMVDMIKSNLR